MLHEYHCMMCDELFIGDGASQEEHFPCGTLAAIVGTYRSRRR